MVQTPTYISQDAQVVPDDAESKNFISKHGSGCESAGDDSTCDPDNASVSASTNLVSSTTPETEPVDGEDLDDSEEAYYEFLREMGCEFTNDVDESDADVENEEYCGSSAEVRALETSPVLENKPSAPAVVDATCTNFHTPSTNSNDVSTATGIETQNPYVSSLADNDQMAHATFTLGPSPWLLRAIKLAQEDGNN